MSVDKTLPCQKTSETQEDMSKYMCKICHGNLGVLGKLWIVTLRSFLVGSTLWPIAACAPKKPPCPLEKRTDKLRLSELSMYNCPPMLEEEKCDVSVVFDVLLPHVTVVRQTCQDLLRGAINEISDTMDEVTNDFFKAQARIKRYFRDEEKLDTRYRFVYTAGLLGFLKSGGLPTRLFSSTCGLTAAGLLCFPRETDAAIRNVSFHTGQAVLKGYYFMTGKKPPCD